MIYIVWQKCDDNAASRHISGIFLRNKLLETAFGSDMSEKIYISSSNRPEIDIRSTDISVSHSECVSAAALSTEFDPIANMDFENMTVLDISCNKIGLDVEAVAGNDKISAFKKIAEKYFFKEENDFLFSLKDDEFLNEFCKMWTVKESVCKASGKGISELKSINAFCKEIKENVFSYPLICKGKKYYLSVFGSKK